LLLLAALLVAGVFLAAAGTADSGTPRLEVVSETPGAMLPPGAAAGIPQVRHLPDGSISITAAGDRNCPVLPTRAERSPAGAVVVLAPVSSTPTCGGGLQLHTTVIRVDGPSAAADVQVQHDAEWRGQ